LLKITTIGNEHMKIHKVTYQHRRDFSAIYECEFCGHRQSDDAGYDDRFYHDNVIPNKKCEKCGESTVSGGGSIDATPTRFPEGQQV
jgi:transcription elongation factor Elf1